MGHNSIKLLVELWMDIQMHAKTAENWLSTYPLMMLYICTKFCESISKGFRVTDLNSRVNTMVAANVDAGQTDGYCCIVVLRPG